MHFTACPMCNRPMRDSPSSPVAPVPSLPLPCAHDRLLPPRCGMSNLTCGSSYGSMLPTAPHRSFLTRISNLTPNDPCAPISRNPFLPNHSPFIDLSTKSLTARVVPPPFDRFQPLLCLSVFPSVFPPVRARSMGTIFSPSSTRRSNALGSLSHIVGDSPPTEPKSLLPPGSRRPFLSSPLSE